MFESSQHRRAKKFMKKAVAQALLGMKKNHGGPFGAVIVRDGEVIARAHNLVLKTHDPTAHAEIVAIRRAAAKLKRFDLSDCEIYSTSEPCPMCLAAIFWAGIRKVYYGCTRKDAERIGFRDRRLYDLIKKRRPGIVEKIKLERRECLKPFEEWSRKKDRVIY
ncbi:MAG TPA: nucleoside deaminase [Candidatus Desulfaltia sp.]|nr:nucleoside deaminase [Candidatus Desulfaltia sp.]